MEEHLWTAIEGELEILENYLHDSQKLYEQLLDGGGDRPETFDYDRFSRYLWRGFLLSLAAMTESLTDLVCCDLEESGKTAAITWAEIRGLRGNRIDTARLFINRIAMLKLPDEQTWDRLKKVQTLRNKAAHHVDDEDQDFSACVEALAETKHFFNQLKAGYLQRMEEIGRPRLV